jgi:hypothetical protein
MPGAPQTRPCDTTNDCESSGHTFWEPNQIGGANCPPASLFAGIAGFCSLVFTSTFSSWWAVAHLVRSMPGRSNRPKRGGAFLELEGRGRSATFLV